jgi:hypothetical protein
VRHPFWHVGHGPGIVIVPVVGQQLFRHGISNVVVDIITHAGAGPHTNAPELHKPEIYVSFVKKNLVAHQMEGGCKVPSTGAASIVCV